MENKKKLFVSCHSLVKGGAERVLSVLSTPFVQVYDEVVYICWYNGTVAYDYDKSVRIINIEDEAGSCSLIKKAFWFRRYVRKEHPSMVLSFLTPTNMLVLASLMGTSQAVVVSERADPNFYFKKYRMESLLCLTRNFLYRKALGIIVQSNAMKNYYKGNLYKKCTIIRNPIYMEKSIIGCGIRCKKSDKVVTVGRLEVFKNQKMLISAFGHFLISHPSYKLYIYGEGGARHELEQQIKNEGLEGKVVLPGSTDSVFDSIKDARVFVLSSTYEGLSNALIEAMCIGLPCISTKVSGSTDIIKHRSNGILIDNGSISQLTDALNEVVDNSDFAKELGINASYLYDILNVDVISKKWMDYLLNMSR